MTEPVTFEIVEGDGLQGIKCLLCGLTSWHPKDVEQKFCGKCSHFHGEVTILPTRSCFDDALTNLIFLMKKEGGRQAVASGDILIVHGIIEPDGVPLSHAWIEQGNDVIDSGILRGEKVTMTLDKAEFYSRGKIKDVTRYTLFQAYAEELRCGHYGPWVERYKRLCNDYSDGKELKREPSAGQL